MSQTPVEGEGSPDSPEAVTPDVVQLMTEQELLDLAVETVQARTPEWTARAGSQEVILLEAFVTLLTSLNFTVTQLPGRVVEHLMRLYGVERDMGGPARAMVRFEVTGSRSIYTVPAGTTVRAEVEEIGETVDFVTNGDLEIETSTGHGVVEATAQEPGDQFNGLAEGMSLDMVDGSLVFVERVTLAAPTSGGRGDETEPSFESRAAALLARQTSTLVLPEQFRAAALEHPGVHRARVLDLYDPTNSDGREPGTHVGHVTVVVADLQGDELTQGQMQELRTRLEEQALASLFLHVMAPTYTTVDITVDVRPGSDEQAQGLAEEIEARLRSWLSPARWEWGASVTDFSIVAEVSRVQGVTEVIAVTGGTELEGVAPLPRPGDISVTVGEPL